MSGRYTANSNKLASMHVQAMEEGAGVVISSGAILELGNVFKFGFASVGTAEQEVWSVSSTYVAQSSASIISIIGSGNDSGKLHLTGTGNDNVIVSTITAFSSTVVASTTVAFQTVNRMELVSTVGDVVNVNEITASFATGPTAAHIGAGEGQTLMAIYRVPKEMEAYITEFDVTSRGTGNPEVTFRLRVQKPGQPPVVKNKFIMINSERSEDMSAVPEKYPAGSLITATAKTTSGTASVSADIHIRLKKATQEG